MVSRSSRGRQKNRGVERRHRNRIVAFMCEWDNKSESNYFKDLLNSNPCIRAKFVPSNNTDPVKMAKDLKNYITDKKLSSKYGDKAFCLIDYDTDIAKKDKIIKAIQILKGTIGKVIVSNPCFEVWLLWHYLNSTKQYNNSCEVINELRKYYPEYNKNNENIYNTVSGYTKTAFMFSQKTAKTIDFVNYSQHDKTYTEIYKIFELLDIT